MRSWRVALYLELNFFGVEDKVRAFLYENYFMTTTPINHLICHKETHPLILIHFTLVLTLIEFDKTTCDKQLFFKDGEQLLEYIIFQYVCTSITLCVFAKCIK
jgi:hypothetical protein